MSNDLIAEYLTKRHAFTEATTAVEAMVKTIQQGVNVLANGNWQRIPIPSGETSPEYTRMREFFPINEWPTTEQIRQLLSQWHTLRQEAEEAYRKVPDTQREGLLPLPEKPPFRHG